MTKYALADFSIIIFEDCLFWQGGIFYYMRNESGTVRVSRERFVIAKEKGRIIESKPNKYFNSKTWFEKKVRIKNEI